MCVMETASRARSDHERTLPLPADLNVPLAIGPGLGAALRRARVEAELPVRELARLCGVSHSRLAALERGRSAPSWALANRLVRLRADHEHPGYREGDRTVLGVLVSHRRHRVGVSGGDGLVERLVCPGGEEAGLSGQGLDRRRRARPLSARRPRALAPSAPGIPLLHVAIPKMGLPAIIVRRPDVCVVTRALPAPADTPSPERETLTRIPGATLIDLRIRKPMDLSLP